MAPGESRTLSTEFLIQGSTAPGTYYLGAIADETDVVIESNEFNNALAGNTIRIR
jgi:subtilase family serine protease